MSTWKSRDLVGRRIVRVIRGTFRTGRSEAPFSYDPIFVLDNGAQVQFVVQEVEGPECYGVEPVIYKRTKEGA